MRLQELKEDKDKEINEVRTQYNSIKEEIRSYERILPTLTFLQENGLTIHQIPAYEDIFTNLKEKILQLEQLNNKFDAFRQKKDEEIEGYRQNE